ncbi:hypothetical protein AgCh_024630 [Apium graveolens]
MRRFETTNVLCCITTAAKVLVETVFTAEPSLEVEIQALKAFKNSVTKDPLGALHDWNDSSHHCNWTGIKCQPSSKQVVSISLVEMKLEGSVSPFLGNLTSLQVLDLTLNSFSGHIPSQLGFCSQLTDLIFYL